MLSSNEQIFRVWLDISRDGYRVLSNTRLLILVRNRAQSSPFVRNGLDASIFSSVACISMRSRVLCKCIQRAISEEASTLAMVASVFVVVAQVPSS